MLLCPSPGGVVLEVRGFHVGQPGQNILQVGLRIDAAPTAAAQDRIPLRTPLAGVRMPNEQKDLFANRSCLAKAG